MADWTEEELAELIKTYQGAGGGPVDLDELSEKVGRHKTNVCRKARALGLTNQQRNKSLYGPKLVLNGAHNEKAMHAVTGERMKRLIQERGHWKGFEGRRHDDKARKVIGEKARRYWESLDDDQRAEMTILQLKGKIDKNGKIAVNKPHGSWKAGWRTVGGREIYFRSRWEANYARYLQWLKEKGQIQEWEFEPKTFWFEQIKRGVRSYLPDFRVTENCGRQDYHEVKGWMDQRSRTTLKRMKKYYPEETVVLIDSKQYYALEKQLSRMLSGWE